MISMMFFLSFYMGLVVHKAAFERKVLKFMRSVLQKLDLFVIAILMLIMMSWKNDKRTDFKLKPFYLAEFYFYMVLSGLILLHFLYEVVSDCCLQKDQ
jgi:hypothetical protein